MKRNDTETNCHCTAEYAGSDHCPECGCEQYESGDCGHVTIEDACRRSCDGRIDAIERVHAAYDAMSREAAARHYGH